MGARDLSKVFANPAYKGKWVTLNRDDGETVVSSGKTAKEAFEKARKLGQPLAPLMHVPVKSDIYFVG